MRYKPYFLIQKRGNNFDLKYFNGRFMFSMGVDVLHALLSENNSVGEKFNCVVAVSLSGDMCQQVAKMFADYPDPTLQALSKDLKGVPWATVQMNPQMAYAFITAIRYIESIKKTKDSLTSLFLFEFAISWKGADIICDVFKESSNPLVHDLVCDLSELIDDLHERQGRFEDNEEIPRGYT